MTHQHTIGDLLKLAPQERLATLWDLEQKQLHAVEKDKKLDLKLILPVNEWEDFKKHVLDGGGVVDPHGLAKIVLTALIDDDQEIFWPELVHFLKGIAKHLGVITAHEGGQVTLNGIVPSNMPPTAEVK